MQTMLWKELTTLKISLEYLIFKINVKRKCDAYNYFVLSSFSKKCNKLSLNLVLKTYECFRYIFLNYLNLLELNNLRIEHSSLQDYSYYTSDISLIE